jgi:hypothetical protein
VSGIPDSACKENPTGGELDSSQRGQLEIFSEEATFAGIIKTATRTRRRGKFSVSLGSENLKSVNSLRGFCEK